MPRRTTLLFALAVTVLVPGAAHASLIISELCDPRLNYLTDRFLEIYNTGDEAVDLTGWTLVAVGNTVDIHNWNLSGDIAPGQALVAGDANPVVDFPVDFPDDAWSTHNSTWNGKVGDGAKLVDPTATIIDYVVVDGTHFENRDYVRNPDITEPSLTYDPGQWTGTFVDYPTQGSPGTHEATPPVETPDIVAVYHTPPYPVAGEEVTISAVVLHESSPIVSVITCWGTDPGALDTTINMSFVTGDTYRTDTPIPGQTAGVTVYYEIEATNDVPASSISNLASYSLPVTLTISEIQGQQASSPYDGDTVVTEGIVTATYGDFAVIQDGVGPWNGLWVQSAVLEPTQWVRLRGVVTESLGGGFDGNTILSGALVLIGTFDHPLPDASPVTTAVAMTEPYEGVLVSVSNAACTDVNLGAGEWALDDGSGPGRAGVLGHAANPTLGTRYDVVGPCSFSYASFKIEPRDAADVTWVGDDFPPVIINTEATALTSVTVAFSEDLDQASAEVATNYAITGLAVDTAQLLPSQTQVALTVSTMIPGNYILTVTNVADLFGNPITTAVDTFLFHDYSPPLGYYEGTGGLDGDDLRLALHQIIDDHHVNGYTFAWTAFYTTDDKPNGYVWDMYSDVPGGEPPYNYVFGDDQNWDGGGEGTGYNREHSWPRAWYGGDISPMNSDLFVLYPTDGYVNGARGSYPYGEVTAPEWTSLNGCKRGPCSYPGYAGTVFEPIDAYKGDFARAYFYMSTRYYTEDGAWPSSDMTDGADLLPWAVDMLLEWHAQDPVSLKELERNETVYGFQENRNPFIDLPGYARLVFGDPTAAPDAPRAEVALAQNAPNPFNPRTVIRFELPESARVKLTIYDAAGRLVRTLVADESLATGHHERTWDGRDQTARGVAAGVYFYRLEVGEICETRSMVLVR